MARKAQAAQFAANHLASVPRGWARATNLKIFGVINKYLISLKYLEVIRTLRIAYNSCGWSGCNVLYAFCELRITGHDPCQRPLS